MKQRETIRTSRSADAQYLLLEQRFDTFEEDVNGKLASLGNQFEHLSARIETWMQSRQPRLNIWIPSIAAVLTGFWFVLNLQMNSNTKSLSDGLSRLEVAVASNTSAVTRNAEATAVLQRDYAKMESETTAHATEVETQIDASAQMTNVILAELHRRAQDAQNALHALGAKMPPASAAPFVLPNISNRNHRKPN